MAKLKGQFTSILYNGYDMTGRHNQGGFNLEYAEGDVTCFGDGAINSTPLLPVGDADFAAFFDPATGQSHDALKAPGTHSGGILMLFLGANVAPVKGDEALLMQADQFTYNVSAEVAGFVMAAWRAKSTGGFTPDLGTLLAYATITNTLTGVSHDSVTATYAGGGTGYLTVFTPVASDTYTLKIQHSTNDSTWVDYITFAANGQARTAERIKSASTLNRYWRALLTRTGGVGQSLGVAVALAVSR